MMEDVKPGKRRKISPPTTAEATPRSRVIVPVQPLEPLSPSQTCFDLDASSVNYKSGTEFIGDSTSLTESVRAHCFEAGRRYHGYRAGMYSFPNDEPEQEREIWMHSLSLELFDGGFFLAPVGETLEKGGQVLDLGIVLPLSRMMNVEGLIIATWVGTGIGAWCEDGIDLSPIQSGEVPPNVSFYVDDMEHEQGWGFNGAKFDFIRMRHTLHAVKDRQELLRRIYEHLKPGGYFEVQELEPFLGCDDGSVPSGNGYAYRAWVDLLVDGVEERGSDLTSIRKIAAEMRDMGFDCIEEQAQKCPIGVWPADPQLRLCGAIMGDCILTGLRGLSARPFAALGWSPDRIEAYLVRVREHVKTIRYHAYMPWWTVYGRKPV